MNKSLKIISLINYFKKSIYCLIMEIIQCKFFMITKPIRKHSYIFFFLFGALFRVLIPDIFIKYYYDLDYKENIIKQLKNENLLSYLLTQKFMEITRNIISALSLGFPHFYYKIRNKDEYNNKKLKLYDNIRKSNLIYNNNDNKSNSLSNTIKIILIIATLDIVCQILIPSKYIFEDKFYNHKITYLEDYHLYCLLLFDIFGRYIFSRLILKTYFYAHHKLSIILCIIGLSPIFFSDFYIKCSIRHADEGNVFDSIFIVVISIQLILYSLEDIMNKVAFRKLSILPSTLIFYNGIAQLVYFIIITILLFYFELININYINYKDEIIYTILFLPFNILRNLYLVKVIDTFSAQHMTILKISERAIIFIYTKIAYKLELKENQFKDKKELSLAIQSFGFALLLLSSLIHNEILIINIPFLKEKTEYYLDKDAGNEQISSCYTGTDTLFSESIDDSETKIYDDLNGSDIS